MSDNSQLVSVIMPVYNAESTIQNSIQSVLQQTYKEFELIIIDDGSTDKSWDIINDAAKIDKRIRPIHQENRGVSFARNCGIKNSKGHYICFIDSDDRYNSNYIEKMKFEMDIHHAQVVICGYTESASKRRVSYPDTLFESFDELKKDFTQIYDSTYLNVPWNKMFGSEYITHFFPEEISLGEDLIFNLKNIKVLRNILIISDSLYYFKTTKSNSLTSRFHNNAFEAALSVHKELNEIIPDKKDFLLNCLWNDYWRCIYKLCLNDNIINREKKKIYRLWESHDEIKCLRVNLDRINCKSKYFYKTDNLTIIRIVLKIITFLKRVRRV